MANVVALLNPKGGCGKTTLAIHLAHAFSMKKQKVLLIDTDPQGSARDWRETVPDDFQAPFPVVGIDRPTVDKDIKALSEGVDWVFIDGAAKLEQMIASALKAADLVLIPIQPSPLDIWACSDLVDLVNTRHQITDGHPTTVFQITRAKKGTRLEKEVKGAIKEYGFPVLDGIIHDRTVFAHSISEGRTAMNSYRGFEKNAALEIMQLSKTIEEAFE